MRAHGRLWRACLLDAADDGDEVEALVHEEVLATAHVVDRNAQTVALLQHLRRSGVGKKPVRHTCGSGSRR